MRLIKSSIILGLVISFTAVFSSSCSVVMAARKRGTRVEKTQAAHTRSQLLSLDGQVVSSTPLPDGGCVEVYRFEQERGSAVRAVMHGVLDLCTGFLWELAGTPTECCLNKKKFFILKVTYDSSWNVQKAELN